MAFGTDHKVNELYKMKDELFDENFKSITTTITTKLYKENIKGIMGLATKVATDFSKDEQGLLYSPAIKSLQRSLQKLFQMYHECPFKIFGQALTELAQK